MGFLVQYFFQTGCPSYHPPDSTEGIVLTPLKSEIYQFSYWFLKLILALIL